MRTLILIALISICPHLHGQNNNDTTIHKWQLDSLENLIFRYKDSTRRLYYEHRVFSFTTSIDTVYNHNDSLSILYRTKCGKVLKRVAQTFRRPGCIMYATTDFLDRNELPEFTVYYETQCFTAEEFKELKQYEIPRYYYERKIYDSLNKLAVRIFWYPRMSVSRFEYHYNQKGEQKVSARSIKAREFWD